MTRDPLRWCCWLLLVIAVLHLGAYAQQSCTAPPKGLVGWWPGDGNYNDITGNNDGVQVGVVPFSNGEVGQAFRFDGASGYVNVPSSTNLPGSNWTIEFWFFLNSNTISQPFVSNFNGSGSRLQIEIFLDPNQPGKPGLRIGHISASADTNSNRVPTLGWHHLAAVHSATTGEELYLDGALIAANQSANVADPKMLLEFGRSQLHRFGEGTGILNGLLDEVSIYNRALSAAEIGAIVAAGPKGKCKGCQTFKTPPPLPGSHWYQLDPNWAGYIYDSVTGPQNTIRWQGCALTALNYMLNTDGQNFTPETLNIEIGKHPGDYSLPITGKPGSGGGISFSSAVIDVTGGSLKFDKSQSGQANPAALDSYLCASPAYPVLVSVYNPSTGHKHYVVVTGQAGNGDYSIVDPGYLFRTRLSNYGTPAQFQVAGVVKPPSGTDPSELDVSVVDYATLLVTAPDGTQTGYDPGTGQVLKGSRQSAYFAVDNTVDSDLDNYPPTSTTYSVQWFLPPNGNYTVELIGLQLGSYELAIKSFDANSQPQTFAVVPGIANVGSTSYFQVQFSSTPGVSTTVIPVASFPTALADISNSLALGVIDNQGIANALSSKINAAADAAGRGDYTSERKILNAFINQVNAQTGKHITGTAPEVLLADATSLLSQIH